MDIVELLSCLKTYNIWIPFFNFISIFNCKNCNSTCWGVHIPFLNNYIDPTKDLSDQRLVLPRMSLTKDQFNQSNHRLIQPWTDPTKDQSNQRLIQPGINPTKDQFNQGHIQPRTNSTKDQFNQGLIQPRAISTKNWSNRGFIQPRINHTKEFSNYLQKDPIEDQGLIQPLIE